MKEKFRLWCDLNEIEDIEDLDGVAERIADAKHVNAQHRYSYLFRWFHDLTHSVIDDETFFTLGDITWTAPVFTDTSGIESVFSIQESNSEDTLYIVEKSAWSYYLWKLGDKWQGIRDILHWKGSEILVV